ncbi:hypothetical protein PMAYCL1PPCAC_24913 [Pristionchus mayeri]|uniref:Uncharacterized protein n=1 Tax=Pristionchus mayeri TaxID=1317129 RepID=A0AAN5I6Z6_9BILA|nr:hypothetical protein PMAYCL1PPCAC_24913 [Pristionchus mayeri]
MRGTDDERKAGIYDVQEDPEPIKETPVHEFLKLDVKIANKENPELEKELCIPSVQIEPSHSGNDEMCSVAMTLNVTTLPENVRNVWKLGSAMTVSVIVDGIHKEKYREYERRPIVLARVDREKPSKFHVGESLISIIKPLTEIFYLKENRPPSEVGSFFLILYEHLNKRKETLAEFCMFCGDKLYKIGLLPSVCEVPFCQYQYKLGIVDGSKTPRVSAPVSSLNTTEFNAAANTHRRNGNTIMRPMSPAIPPLASLCMKDLARADGNVINSFLKMARSGHYEARRGNSLLEDDNPRPESEETARDEERSLSRFTLHNFDEQDWFLVSQMKCLDKLSWTLPQELTDKFQKNFTIKGFWKKNSFTEEATLLYSYFPDLIPEYARILIMGVRLGMAGHVIWFVAGASVSEKRRASVDKMVEQITKACQRLGIISANEEEDIFSPQFNRYLREEREDDKNKYLNEDGLALSRAILTMNSHKLGRSYGGKFNITGSTAPITAAQGAFFLNVYGIVNDYKDGSGIKISLNDSPEGQKDGVSFHLDHQLSLRVWAVRDSLLRSTSRMLREREMPFDDVANAVIDLWKALE